MELPRTISAFFWSDPLGPFFFFHPLIAIHANSPVRKRSANCSCVSKHTPHRKTGRKVRSLDSSHGGGDSLLVKMFLPNMALNTSKSAQRGSHTNRLMYEKCKTES